ncbi:Thioredoxin-like protein [Gracilaria domingensis]|nr:Thioredoxin-like protein [Gracilaria domingensis]
MMARAGNLDSGRLGNRTCSKRVAFAVPGAAPVPTFRPAICKVGSAPKSPRVVIEYCTGCRWGLRAAWMAQELLVTFEKELGEVALRPGSESGIFDVWVDSAKIWSRRDSRRFPELKEIKRAVRDLVDPDKSLGHSDKK